MVNEGYEYTGCYDYNEGGFVGQCTAVYPDGSKYVGHFKRGSPDGDGTLTFKGEVQKGQWLASKRHGLFNSVFVNGNTYVGEYKHDKMEGHGKYVWSSGGCYEGQFVKGKPQGKGTYKYANGSIYKGEWVAE